MKILRAVAAALLGVLACSRAAFSQDTASEPDLASSVATAQKAYTNAFVGHPQLYSGPEYLDYARRYHARTGHQFFLTPEKQAGSIYYNDHYFSNLQLAYDEVLEQVIISPPSSPLTLRLLNEQVRCFTIGGHRFVRLVADSVSRKVIDTGFYEVLVDSTVQVLAKRVKTMQERLVHPYIDAEFSSYDKLFIKKAGRYYAVASKSSVTHLFSDHSKEVQQYLQAHKLKFKKTEREAAIVQLAAYYSGLPPR